MVFPFLTARDGRSQTAPANNNNLEEPPKSIKAALLLAIVGITGVASTFVTMFYGIALLGNPNNGMGIIIITLLVSILGIVSLIFTEYPMLKKNLKMLWKNKENSQTQIIKERNQMIYNILVSNKSWNGGKSTITLRNSKTILAKWFIRAIVILFTALSVIIIALSVLKIIASILLSFGYLFPSGGGFIQLFSMYALNSETKTFIDPTALGELIKGFYIIAIIPWVLVLMSIVLSCVDMFKSYYKSRNLPKEYRSEKIAYANRMFLGSMLFRLVFYGLFAITGFLPFIMLADPLFMLFRMGLFTKLIKSIFPLKRSAKYYQDQLKIHNPKREKALQIFFIILGCVITVALIIFMINKFIDPELTKKLSNFWNQLDKQHLEKLST
ncbi:hypothetical protein NEFER03_1964 [Nematocida sp. LUAm3]|nr:hypothetical protein NEFER03_1964 [Nematocida sp. LUAm3]KAI5176048.1 hypothetical protein NEFER02_1882 [Nematocida sp. LUAm2]KAI5177092.1 hypothetical protein NEFER01_0367 [Nematocida sp. LUAm1]